METGSLSKTDQYLLEHRCVTAVEGIIDDDVDQCIRNLTRIGRDGMNETDRLVLDIMTSKN